MKTKPMHGVYFGVMISMLAAVAGSVIAAPPAQPATQDSGHPWDNTSLSPAFRTALVLNEMTQEDQLTLVAGYYGVYSKRVPAKYKADMPDSAGYVPGIPRLGIPALKETDASLGVANGGNMRPGDEAVALPSSIMTAATWNPRLAYEGGAMIGAEARNKGFNVLLAGGINLTRDPRGGRTFEYSGEDPALAGIMVGESIRGIQDLKIISTIKHFALNDHETGRMVLNAEISESALRESDLLAFELAMTRGAPGSVMCAYNRIDSAYACENDFLLNQVLKQEWGFGGFVMSDWGAVHSTVDAANHGLDQESSQFSDTKPFFAAPLKAAVESGDVSPERLHDMAGRILRTMFAKGVYDHPVEKRPLDLKTDLAVAQRDAEEGIVLLHNPKGALPIQLGRPRSRRILVVGGYADIGVMSGGGSSQVIPIGYSEIRAMKTGKRSRVPGATPVPPDNQVVFQPPSPLSAIRNLAGEIAPGARVRFYNGQSIAAAVKLARGHDIVIVFATQWMQEGRDNRDISLPNHQDALIAALAKANPRTIVVLETGGPVLMPWLDKVAGVLEAWYPGNRGAGAIANVLFGRVNPSGHLPVTFPQSVKQLPRRYIAGFGTRAPRSVTNTDITAFDTFYQEGALVGYKWFAANDATPLFPFGYGLSYTRFRYDQLAAAGGPTITVNFDMTNTGKVAGKALGQIYVIPPDGSGIRMVGWSKEILKPGETRRVAVRADRRLLAHFDIGLHKWHILGGDYQVLLARSATDAVAQKTVHMENLYFDP